MCVCVRERKRERKKRVQVQRENVGKEMKKKELGLNRLLLYYLKSETWTSSCNMDMWQKMKEKLGRKWEKKGIKMKMDRKKQ